jgi:hypothetical protein
MSYKCTFQITCNVLATLRQVKAKISKKAKYRPQHPRHAERRERSIVCGITVTPQMRIDQGT